MKLKDVARITTRDGETSSPFSSIKYKTVKELGSSAKLRDLVLATIHEYTEPMSVAEVSAHINNTLKTSHEDAIVKYNLESLVSNGDILKRTETPEERLNRANGVIPTMNKLAHMYFQRGVGVPHRRTVELVPGVILKGPASPRKKYKSAAGKAKPSKPVTASSTPAVDTVALDFLIEKLVKERTADLQKQLDEANQKLAQFKKLLS
jgi:hypothetical protein